MKRIVIDFIPHKDQRYDTCGDWQFQVGCGVHMQYNNDCGACKRVKKGELKLEDNLRILVSQTPDWRSSALVAVHELIEALLCKHAGITDEEVDKFDLNWKPRVDQQGRYIEEPGDDPIAPYHQEHTVATEIEKRLCGWLEYSWEAHSMAVDELE